MSGYSSALERYNCTLEDGRTKSTKKWVPYGRFRKIYSLKKIKISVQRPLKWLNNAQQMLRNWARYDYHDRGVFDSKKVYRLGRSLFWISFIGMYQIKNNDILTLGEVKCACISMIKIILKVKLHLLKIIHHAQPTILTEVFI